MRLVIVMQAESSFVVVFFVVLFGAYVFDRVVHWILGVGVDTDGRC
jgi:hypothetical protein